MQIQLDRKTELLPNLEYSYDKKAQRFRNKSSGKFLSQNQALKVLESGINDRKSRITDSIDRYLAGSIEIDKFMITVADFIKDLHILNAVIAVGGRKDQLTKQQLSVLQDRVKSQMTTTKDPISGDKYGLQVLARELLKGEVSEAQLRNRLAMYVNSAEQTQEYIEHEKQKTSGKTEGLRRLGTTENCPECLEYAGLGWVKLENLILPGQKCRCGSNCKCFIVYR